jgi:hypothetical protein
MSQAHINFVIEQRQMPVRIIAFGHSGIDDYKLDPFPGLMSNDINHIQVF